MDKQSIKQALKQAMSEIVIRPLKPPTVVFEVDTKRFRDAIEALIAALPVSAIVPNPTDEQADQHG